MKNGNKSEIMTQIAIKKAFATCLLVWKEFQESDG